MLISSEICINEDWGKGFLGSLFLFYTHYTILFVNSGKINIIRVSDKDQFWT
jgi:hypothetical protein